MKFFLIFQRKSGYFCCFHTSWIKKQSSSHIFMLILTFKVNYSLSQFSQKNFTSKNDRKGDRKIFYQKLILSFSVTVLLPDIVGFAVGLSIAHEARTTLVQILTTLDAFETLGMPLQIWRHTQYKLVVYFTATTETHREQIF